MVGYEASINNGLDHIGSESGNNEVLNCGGTGGKHSKVADGVGS